MVNNKCPLCGSNEYKINKRYRKIGRSKYGCEMVCCVSCGHYFSKIKNDVDFEELYSSGQYEVIDTRESIFDKIISIDDNFILMQLSKLKVIHKTLLDFGCGKGQFIYRALKYGWKVKGIETAKKRAEFGKKNYGLDISTNEYKSGTLGDAPFNIITLFHVLEHLTKPKELLTELIHHNLKKNGYMVIEVPLFGSIQSKLAGKRWIHLDPPLHISHFTKSALLRFLGELNLHPVKIEYFSVHLGILGMVQSIMSLFGYNKVIISELKFRRTKRLMITILFVLPFAFLLELYASIFKKGGIIRVYCRYLKSSAI